MLIKIIFIFSITTSLVYAATKNNVKIDMDNICMKNVVKMAKEHDIPIDILGAVALTETGVRRRNYYSPHPWAINVNGKGYIFNSKSEAIKTTKKYISSGIKSIDIGCMQMNWKWHKDKFSSSLDKMFNPKDNIYFGAKYLKEHYKKFNNWEKAIGRYHSGTFKYSQKYIAKARLNRIVLQNTLGEHSVYSSYNHKLLKYPVIFHDDFFNKPVGSLINFENVSSKSRFIDLPDAPEPLITPLNKPLFQKPL